MKKHIKFFLVFCGVILCLAACDSDDANEEKIESIEREIKELKDEQQENSSKEEEASFFVELEVIEEPVYIPSGNMTLSVFDLQNMEMTPVEAFGMCYSYKSMPIEVDVPDVRGAYVEDALFKRFGNNYVFTYDLFDADVPDQPEYLLIYRVTSIINSKADPEKTKITCLNEEVGYINGCQGWCHTYEILVEGEKNPYYASVYELLTFEGFNFGDNEIIIGCMGMGKDASYMQERYDVATAMVRSLRINEKRREVEFKDTLR